MQFPLIDGFDTYNGVGAGVGLASAWQDVGSNITTMVAGRFGGQAVRLGDGAGNFAQQRRIIDAPISAFSLGFAIKQDTIANLSTGFPLLYLLDSALGVQLSFYLDQTGKFTWYRGNGAAALVASGVNEMIASTWEFVEIYGTINGAAGSIDVWANGADHIGSFNGNTLGAANANIQAVQIAAPNAAGSNNFVYFDDMFLGDQAVRLGERRVETVRPAGDTAQKDFAPDSGGTNFNRVNEAVADGDTSFVSANVVGARDLYSLSPLSSTPAVIDAVQLVAFADKTDATARTLELSCQSNGVDNDGAAFALSATYGRFSRVLTTDPSGGGAWSPSRVNNLLVGPKVAA